MFSYHIIAHKPFLYTYVSGIPFNQVFVVLESIPSGISGSSVGIGPLNRVIEEFPDVCVFIIIAPELKHREACEKAARTGRLQAEHQTHV